MASRDKSVNSNDVDYLRGLFVVCNRKEIYDDRLEE